MADELETELTPEEQTAEQEALQDVKEDDLRTQLAEDLGLDPEEHSETLDKAVARELKQRKMLSTAIKQKQTWRDKAKLAKPPTEKTDKPEDIDALMDKKLDEREFDRLDLSDDLRDEVKKLAKSQSISLMEASKDPYIAFKKSEKEKEKRLENATPKRTGNGFYTNKTDGSKPLNASDFDMSTPEGRKAWDEAKAARRAYVNNNS